MLYLFRFLNGFLRLEISGDFPERLINKCAKSGIILWNIKYSKEKIFFCVLLRDFYKLFTIRKGYKIRVHIKSKYGFPFLVNRYKHRYGFFIGFILFVFILNFLSGYIWEIKVEGNKNVSTSSIIKNCEDIGVIVGTKKKNINTSTSSEKLLISNENLAWAAFNIEGCVLTVDVTEVKNTKGKNAEKPTNIRAAADGKITKIIVTAGNCVVCVGDNVTKGQLLVSGIIEGMHETQFVHSIGEIYAQTKKTYTYAYDYEQEVNVYADNLTERKVLSLFGMKIPLYLGRLGDGYIKGECTKKYLFSEKIPIAVYSSVFTPFEKTVKKYGNEALIQKAEKSLESKIKGEGISEYTVEKKEVTQENTGITVKFTVTAQENIAYEDILLYNSER